MTQSKKQSFIETMLSTFIGVIVSMVTQFFVFPIYDLKVSLLQNIQITMVFTLVSILRAYFIRRIFNKRHIKILENKIIGQTSLKKNDTNK